MRPQNVAPRISQRAMRQLWRAAFDAPWPGLNVRFDVQGPTPDAAAKRIEDYAYCYSEIVLSWGLLRRRRHPLRIVLHEFIHVRMPNLGHGAEFVRVLNRLCARVGVIVRGGLV